MTILTEFGVGLLGLLVGTFVISLAYCLRDKLKGCAAVIGVVFFFIAVAGFWDALFWIIREVQVAAR